MDELTKWLVRLASSVIILTGLILAVSIPIFALKVNAEISAVEDSFQAALKLLSQQFLS
tara:strand:+ start:17252 stop:17428 length:177 start_codon:yes stop_codon:yes gene_type:complete